MNKIATLLLLALVFACKKEESLAMRSTDTAAVTSRAVDGSAAPVAEKASVPVMPRMIVRNATVHIVVADTAKAVDAVTASIEGLGGYVGGSEVWREGELLRARLTLRVPSAKLTPALAAIRKLSQRVDNETIASEEVTQQYVDHASRLRNLEATEIELRELLATVRKNARRAADILEVHQQLVAIRGEIETTKGRMQQLAQSAAMSQISLEMTPNAVTKPVTAEGEWEPVVIAKDASRALLAALRAIAASAIWLIIYVVPICGMIALAAWTLVAIARRLRRRVA